LLATIEDYLCTVACGMRRSFDGLSMMAEHSTRSNPYSGHPLVFCNERSDRVKILYRDRDGWVIPYMDLAAARLRRRYRKAESEEQNA